tara:strand:+ start:2940 stop:3542 length:603 start_codon:yes stop_codon:yes gene_type:complete
MKHEIVQHNFTSYKPESIFTTYLDKDDVRTNIIDEIKKSGDKQDYKTNVKAYMTDWNMADKPGFQELNKHIIDTCHYLNSLYYRKTVGLQVSNLWGMMYKKGDYAMVHDHWPALWSGVYYLRAPEGSGDLVFPQLKQRIQPKNNLLVIFKGDVRHGVEESKTDEERICVSFNVKEEVQPVGYEDTKQTIKGTYEDVKKNI